MKTTYFVRLPPPPLVASEFYVYAKQILVIFDTLSLKSINFKQVLLGVKGSQLANVASGSLTYLWTDKEICRGRFAPKR